MPTWFQNQMKKAFLKKDRYQIKLLNQCWFFYQKKHFSRQSVNTRDLRN